MLSKLISQNKHKFTRLSCLILVTIFLSGCNVLGNQGVAGLQVTSTPEASLFLDGKHVGKTPFKNEQLKAKEYVVKLTVSEATYVDKITLSPNTLTVINRELNNNYLAQSGENLWLVPGKGGLFISSFPQGAEITIDGRSFGVTPTLISHDKLPAGYEETNGNSQTNPGSGSAGSTKNHKISLFKEGYVEREFSVKISKDSQLVADITLASKIAKDGKIENLPILETKLVEIERTRTGFVEVRQEPLATSEEIGRVKSGDTHELIQEIQGWYKILFEGRQGWVLAQNAQKL